MCEATWHKGKIVISSSWLMTTMKNLIKLFCLLCFINYCFSSTPRPGLVEFGKVRLGFCEKNYLILLDYLSQENLIQKVSVRFSKKSNTIALQFLNDKLTKTSILPNSQVPNSFFWYNLQFCYPSHSFGKEDTLILLLSAWDRSRDSTAKRNLSKDM